MNETLITRDKLQKDLEDLYNYKIKPYLNGEGRTVIIKSGTITKNSPSYTFTDIPTSYRYTIDFFCSKDINYININTSIPTEVTITYDSNDINENETLNVYCRLELITESQGPSIVSTAITTYPTMTHYNTGYKLNLNEVRITAYFSDELSNDVTDGVIYDPPNQTVLNEEGDFKVTCTFHNFVNIIKIKVANRKLLSALPYNFAYGSAVVLNNEIHILGGIGGNKSHYKWDGTSWVSVSTLPFPFQYGAAVIYRNQIHIFGSNDIYNDRKHYKWNGYMWEEMSTIPYQFYGSAVVLNDEIHLLGSINTSYHRAHYKWDGTNMVWTNVSNLPFNFCYGSAIVYNNEIHILGGTGSNKAHYKWNGSEWSSVSTLPIEFTYSNAVTFLRDDNVEEIHLLCNTSHYKFVNNAWTSVATIPYNFYSSAVIWNSGAINDIVILGSNNSSYYKRIGQYDKVSGWRSV